MRFPRNSRCKAFTLIDMLAAILIVGIIASITGPRFSASLNAHRSEAGARLIAADLEYLRRQAITQSKSVTVTFDPARFRYSSADAPALEGSIGPFRRSLRDWVGAVRMTVNLGTGSQLRFDMRGRPSADGADLATASIVVGSVRRWHVTIDPTIGTATATKVRVE